MKTRRQFLLNCSTLALAAGVLPTGLLAGSTRPVVAGSFESFRAQVGSIFTVASRTGAPVRVELAAAEEWVSQHPQASSAFDAQHEKFSLLFRPVTGAALSQDTYEFSHAELGQLLVFVVPVKVAGSDHFHYEAIFNRLRPESLV